MPRLLSILGIMVACAQPGARAGDDVPGVSVSFVGYTNCTTGVRLVLCPSYFVPERIYASCTNENELARALRTEPDYVRFEQIFALEGDPKYAVFKLANEGSEKFVWTVERILAWPKDGSAVYECPPCSCQTNVDGQVLLDVLFPNKESFLAVQVPRECRHWQCRFVLCAVPFDPKTLLGPDMKN